MQPEQKAVPATPQQGLEALEQMFAYYEYEAPSQPAELPLAA